MYIFLRCVGMLTLLYPFYFQARLTNSNVTTKQALILLKIYFVIQFPKTITKLLEKSSVSK